MARVELRDVSKKFSGGVTAVESLDLLVEDGELVVLVGPSGSGKTTILRLVAGLERPTGGKICIGEREVTNVPPRQRDVAYVPQSCPLYPHLSVYGNLAFGERLRHGSILTRWWRRFTRSAEVDSGKSPAERSAAIRHTAEQLGIGCLLERWPRQLSGGERQRVALGRAIVREPAAFLFDEPLASLDPTLRRQLRADLKQWHRQAGRATLHVTHDQAEALALGDRIVVLERGKVQQVGSPAAICDRPANRFVARFVGGSPPINLLPGNVQEQTGSWFFVGAGWELKLPAGIGSEACERELGLRAEAIEIFAAAAPADATAARVSSVVRQCEGREITLIPQAAPGDPVVTTVPVHIELKEGQIIAWRPRWSMAHWFDRQTGKRSDLQ